MLTWVICSMITELGRDLEGIGIGSKWVQLAMLGDIMIMAMVCATVVYCFKIG